MTLRRLLAVIVLVGVLGGCDRPPAATRGTPNGTVGRDSSPVVDEPREHAPTGARVDNLATGGSHARIERAVRDLKRIGLWDDLSAHLFVIEIQSRAGREEVPDDKHLADAFLTATIEEGGSGGFCSIMFYPTAISDDLRKWRRYHEDGYHPDEPPTNQQFWTAILGHELGHCFKGQPGEKVAEYWEAKVLAALRRAEIE